MIARTMSQYYAPHTRAIHLNFIPVIPPYPWRNPIRFLQSLSSVPFSASERAKVARTIGYVTQANAYMKIMETKPQTIGYGLHDSPVALLAWIYEKLHDWRDGYPWTDEEVLTWVSIYYFSRAGPMASGRIYYEASASKPEDGTATEGEVEGSEGKIANWMTLLQVLGVAAPADVRFAVAEFKEIVMWPMAWYRAIGNVVKEKQFDRGGHFAAWEVPELLAGDLKEFLGKEGPAYGVVAGKNGY